MRQITKPPLPQQLGSPTVAEFVRVLGNAVGRYCSFCEKALTFQLLLFHKGRGVLYNDSYTDSQISAADWPNLLLICGDCAANMGNFDPSMTYFWPDEASVAQQAPFLYKRWNDVPWTAQDSDENTIAQGTISVVLVQISSDIPQDLQTKAHNTYSLFRLNGRFFNEDLQKPAYTLPYEEYVEPSDIRLEQRLDAYWRAVDAAQALAPALAQLISTASGEPAYFRNILVTHIQDQLALIDLSVQGFGFLSTWVATISTVLDSLDPKLRPQLIALMTGQPAPPRPLDRKRSFTQMEDGIQQAEAVSYSKRTRLEQTLAQLIASQA